MREEYFVYISGINPFISEYGVVQQIYFDFFSELLELWGVFQLYYLLGKLVNIALNL